MGLVRLCQGYGSLSFLGAPVSLFCFSLCGVVFGSMGGCLEMEDTLRVGRLVRERDEEGRLLKGKQ